MSRRNPNITVNPTNRYLEWDSDEANIKWYNKNVEENIHIDLPFTFLLLERAVKIGGWNDNYETAIYSNEVLQTSQTPFTVRFQKNNEVIAEGYWSDIKDEVGNKGGRFMLSLYIACPLEQDGELQVCNLTLKGASLGSFFDFMKEAGMEAWEQGIQIYDFGEDKKGKVEYTYPKWRLQEVSEQAHEKALKMTDTVVEYLEQKIANAPVIERAEKADYPDSQPRPDNAGESKKEPPTPKTLEEEFGDIDDDLPF